MVDKECVKRGGAYILSLMQSEAGKTHIPDFDIITFSSLVVTLSLT